MFLIREADFITNFPVLEISRQLNESTQVESSKLVESKTIRA